jgi:enoyl-[acyl-carrier protein] reductase II
VVINQPASNAGLGLDWCRFYVSRSIARTHPKCKKATKTFCVNVPMLYPNIEEIMKIIVDEVKIVYIGRKPKTWTAYLKENGITVVHVVSSSVFY